MKTGVLVGIDIGGTNTKLALVDRRGRVLARDMIDTNAPRGPEALFRELGQRIPGLLGARRSALAAGVGCAGLIDERGRLHASPNLPGWEKKSLGRIARRHLGVNTTVDNDANAAAYGEYKRGCGKNARMLVCVTLGTGVGGGIVSQGRILKGASGYASEIGHMTLHLNGPRCKCGNRGCLEAYLGTDALVRSARGLLAKRKRPLLASGKALTPEVIARAARNGDSLAREVFERAARHLGTALASLVNLLNPDTIAIAGGVAGGFDLMKQSLNEEIVARAFTEPAKAVSVHKAQLGNDAAAVGAALIASDAAGSPPGAKRPASRRR
jgi:glucokinase